MPHEMDNATCDFVRTADPEGRASSPRRQPIFVVQEHHASRLHYDFRLEADGVLKSWAVPKPPTLDPSQRRLAVEVADHPLSYARFAGTIPQGQYGGGTVAIWDHGTYDNLIASAGTTRTVAEGIAAGRLEFALHGERLRGKFALIRMRARGRGKPQWLLIKQKDVLAEAGRPAAPGTPAAAPSAHLSLKGAPRRGPKRAKPAGAAAVTHPEIVLFADPGLTKADEAVYYAGIAERLLPSNDRPVILERLPEWFEGPDATPSRRKHVPSSLPDWITAASAPTVGPSRNPTPWPSSSRRSSIATTRGC